MDREKLFLDSRIVKTKRALKNAFLDLLSEKKFNDITVTDIVNRANINRGSFYNHFQSKEDLLQYLIKEAVNNLTIAYRKPYLNQKPFFLSNLTSSSVQIFNSVKENSDFYTAIIKSDILYSVQTLLQETIKELNEKELFKNTPKLNRELVSSYLGYAIVGLIFKWVDSGFKYDSEYMAEQLLEMMKVAPTQMFKTRIES